MKPHHLIVINSRIENKIEEIKDQICEMNFKLQTGPLNRFCVHTTKNDNYVVAVQFQRVPLQILKIIGNLGVNIAN